MKIEQIYTGCLAQGAYYIVSGNEAAIIDPLRDPAPYLERLQKDGVTLKYIFETHFHADFVSGHVDLANKTGAKIIYGPNASCGYNCVSATDGELFELGNIRLKVLHTPGHTMESSCYLLLDEQGQEKAVFTGDTLFIGDVGRPDLAQKATGLTQEQLAAHLFHSLRTKLMTLNDDVTVYPGHGAGSACGKNMSNETVSTIRIQKNTNYALRSSMTEKEFIEEVTAGLLPPPQYFGFNVKMNKEGYASIESVISYAEKALTPNEFEVAAESLQALILDTRHSSEFSKGFVPRSINIGIDGDFAPWVGTMLVDVKLPLLLITEPGRESEVATRLARVGFDNIIGHLKGGIVAWKEAEKEFDEVHRISAEQFSREFKEGESKVLDIRRESEYAAEHVSEAYSRPLAYINNWVKDIQPNEHFYIHCAGGYRSMIAASILLSRGYRNFSEVEGGFNAIAKTAVKRTDYVCQSKVKLS
ncbi:MAG: MBL fold metallo-hydrolase [Chloroherpetonaceae bacterium]|nr:MBL fold metallo-hydrolase [Chloroherpetonaceae bacterium]